MKKTNLKIILNNNKTYWYYKKITIFILKHYLKNNVDKIFLMNIY